MPVERKQKESMKTETLKEVYSVEDIESLEDLEPMTEFLYDNLTEAEGESEVIILITRRENKQE